mmetsp:Transcript_1483/g.3666  ORF Transcript_1483/g.3666 Transcript_1483/m.3666 type:complete len:150 (+) Transcript_1483:226-675(+)
MQKKRKTTRKAGSRGASIRLKRFPFPISHWYSSRNKWPQRIASGGDRRETPRGNPEEEKGRAVRHRTDIRYAQRTHNHNQQPPLTPKITYIFITRTRHGDISTLPNILIATLNTRFSQIPKQQRQQQTTREAAIDMKNSPDSTTSPASL